MVFENILDAMGNTPLIKLNRMAPSDSAEILVKFEGLNVGGSIKTRTAYNMICEAEKEGRIHKDTIIVEPTSGNQGIGLALAGAVKGYKVRIIMPDSVSEERRKLISHYGAELVLIHDDGNIGKCIEECLETALDMAKENPYPTEDKCILCRYSIPTTFSLTMTGDELKRLLSELERTNEEDVIDRISLTYQIGKLVIILKEAIDRFGYEYIETYIDYKEINELIKKETPNMTFLEEIQNDRK